MKNITYFLFILAVLTGLSFAGVSTAFPSGGDVYYASFGQTITGIQRAVNGQSGTMIMAKDNMMLFMWTMEKGWCFAGVNIATQNAIHTLRDVSGGGNLVNARTMADVVDFLEKHGWELVSTSAVPQAVKTAALSAGTWLSALASTMPTFFVMPAGTFFWTQNQLIEMYGLTEQ